MACEICGRNSCTRSFHSLEDQQEHDNKFDEVKDGIKDKLLYRLKRLTDYYSEDDIHCVSVSDVEDMISDVFW